MEDIIQDHFGIIECQVEASSAALNKDMDYQVEKIQMQSEFAKQMAEIAQNDDNEGSEPLTV